MTDAKIVAVIGAAGAQGGGLARAIVDDPHGGFACRAVTREPASNRARALAERGAEVVRADKELEQASHLAGAAKAAGVHHAVWSTQQNSRDRGALEDDRFPTLQGRYKVPHWDAKGEANQFFIDHGVPTTFLLLPTFWDNLLTPGAPQRPQRGPDGVLAITAPMGDMSLPGIALGDH